MHKNVIIPDIYFGFFILLAKLVFATVPYVPSQVFVSPQHNGSLAYLLLPKESSQNGMQLVSLNTSNVDATNPRYHVLFDPLPFHNLSESAAFVPAMDSQGTIKIYAGDCQSSLSAGVVWSFSPDNSSMIGNGTWSKSTVEIANGVGIDGIRAPNYLSAGFTYSTVNQPSSSLYAFGGMCPFGGNSSGDWISSAEYSQTMIMLDPSGVSPYRSYGLGESVSRDPPIAEAGLTITPLQAMSSLTSAGRELQQQNLVLVGGHTQNAFINMSLIALFSLPEESWTFVNIDSSTDTRRADRITRSVEVEPRSGHTTVLSPDGSKLIIFGGWVGDTSVPADPQLAILEIGEAYGGSGNWGWSVPSHGTGDAPPEGFGIFGHAATMLSGDIMMIAGGYIIEPESTKRSSSGMQLNSRVYLYNVTSNSWISTYMDPVVQNLNTGKAVTSGALSPGQRAGLGIGLTISTIAIIGVLYLLYSRKRARRQDRERELRKLALGAERPHFWDEPDAVAGYSAPLMSQLRLPGLGGTVPDSAYPNQQQRPEWAEKTGILVEVPGPSKDLRTSLQSRMYSYRPAGVRYEDPMKNRVVRSIHPIDERDEYEEVATEDPGQEADLPDSKGSFIAESFSDSSLASRRSMSPTKEGSILGQQNSADNAENDNLQREGSVSPDKSERTISNLSESSVSALTVSSLQHSNLGSIRRGGSGRSEARRSVSTTPTLERPSSVADGRRESSQKSSYILSYAGASNDYWGSHTADSFSTARQSPPAERTLLLGDSSEWATPPESPAKMSTGPKMHGMGWIGGVRKTLMGSKRTADADISTTGEGSAGPNIERRFGGFQNPAGLPRRAVSASAALLKRKMASRDWDTDPDKRGSGSSFLLDRPPSESGAMLDRYWDGNYNDEYDDWDIEAFSQNRTVQQVTYTAPKEKLRVVNPDILNDDESDKLPRRSTSQNSYNMDKGDRKSVV